MPRSATREGEFALIAALARGASVSEAAEASGLNRSTVLRRLQEPDLRTQVQEARSQLIAETIGRLSEAATKAVDTLLALLGARSEMARLGSARTILEMLAKYRETEDIEQRVIAVEELAQSRIGELEQEIEELRQWQSHSGYRGSSIG